MFTPRRLCALLVCASVLAAAAPVPTASQEKEQRPLEPAVAAILKLADELNGPNVAEEAKKIVAKYDSCEISQVFTQRNRGGAGIGTAASLPGHRDAIHHLVHHWAAGRAPKKEELEAHQKDLVKAARVLQAMAELAPHRRAMVLPKDKYVAEWATVSAEFKTRTREFREAIESVDADQVRKAAVNLQKSCNSCHVLVGI